VSAAATLGVYERVVAWQRVHGRHHLPWQQRRTPYRVWLSEVMLQQTQVNTVVQYFDRFTQQLPTVQALAAASLDEVLQLWAGLGYYRRARLLHACAQVVVKEHGGEFPRQWQALAALPGIGRSTAAAIASVCFEQPVSILDGNVLRVLGRYWAVDDDVKSAAVQRRMWQAAQNLLPAQTPHMPTYTQGLMDLGALVCTRTKPRCQACPLRTDCKAYAHGQPEAWPVRRAPPSKTEQHWWLLLATQGSRIWLQRRPEGGIWGGLWAPPVFTAQALCAQAAGACQAQHEWPGPSVVHDLTHRRLHLQPLWLEDARHAPGGDGQWFERQALPGMPAPIKRLLLGLA